MFIDRIWSIWLPAWDALRDMFSTLKPDSAAMRTDDGERLPAEVRDGIAIVSIDGPMIKNGGWVEEFFGLTSTLAVRRAVEKALVDDSVKSIVLRIDTPGGSVDGLAELGDTIYKGRSVKPIIAQVDGMAASAGYYVASQASKIVAQRMDMIGSIGTRMMLYDTSMAYLVAGIKAIPIDSAPEDRPFKSAGEDGTEITDQQIDDFQRLVDGYFADFKSSVIRGRSMPEEQFDAIADGRVWIAPEAQKLGLIDGIATMEETLAELATRNDNADAMSRLAKAKYAAMSR